MIAYPWYLLALGIVILIIGWLAAAMSRPSAAPPRIDSRMRDDDIARSLQNEERVGLPGIIMLVGIVCIVASLVWRIARIFV